MENKQVEVGTMTKDYNLTVAELEKMSEKCSVLVENRGYSQGIVTLKELDDLSVVPQMDRGKTMRIIDLVHASVNKNDLLGIAVDSIENNINAKFRLSYNHKTQKKREEKLLERAKEIIDDFNKQGIEFATHKPLISSVIPAPTEHISKPPMDIFSAKLPSVPCVSR